MNYFFKIAVLCVCAANTLFAWTDYGQNYYQGYGQPYGGYQDYGYDPYQDNQYYGQPTEPTKTPTTTPLQGEGSLENKYPNLVVMFTKDACPYCQYMKPIMEAMMSKYGKSITIMFADIVQNPQYVSQYGFATVPHVVYFKNGKQLESHGSGNKTMTAEQVEEKIKKHFGDVIDQP